MPVALVTGASKGLGRGVALELARLGWSLVVDARREDELAAAASEMRALAGTAAPGGAGIAVAEVVAIPGDVADPSHRAALVDAAARLGGLDLVLNNASTLGPSPLLSLAMLPADEWRRILEVNVIAPSDLVLLALPLLQQSPAPVVVNITSDASVENYETWGGYGASKAALDHLSLTWAKEMPELRVLVIDPGDMRTEMHQAAFPGQDISDRPLPESVAPVVLAMLTGDLASGRYKASEFASDASPGRDLHLFAPRTSPVAAGQGS